MAETVELGGNIALTGFSEIDGASMIILKKIIGSHVREVSERDMNFKRLEVILSNIRPYKLEAVLTSNSEKRADASNDNLFIALNCVLKELEG